MEKLNTILSNRGRQPELYILDNECSNELKSAMTKHKIDYQLVPPHVHCRNAVERAIQTFKHHFLSGLATADPDFPVNEWDRLLPQATLTLNLLRNSRVNTKLSAHAFLHGNFDFSSTPLAPPGTKVLVHSKPKERNSWSFHGKEAWYIGPAPEHYRCVKCYMPSTHSEIISDTVQFFPHIVPFPQCTTTDFLKKSALDIITLLDQRKNYLPTLENGDEITSAYQQIATLLNRTEELPPTPEPSSTPPTPVPQQQPVPVPPPRVDIVPPLRVEKKDASLPRVEKVATKPTPQQVNIDLSQQIVGGLRKKWEESPSHQAPSLYQRIFKRKEHTNFRAQATNHLAQCVFLANHIYNRAGRKENIDSLLRGPMKSTWTNSVSNEFGRLLRGNKNGVSYTDTMEFIPKHEVPPNRDVTYANFVFDYRPLKDEPYRARMVVGGDKLTYHDNAGSPAASLLETKLLLNSIISDADKGARFLSLDLKDFFLCSTMSVPEYMRIPIKHIPEDIIKLYNITPLIHNGYAYVKIKRGMYGLKQAAWLAFEQLREHLEPHGYFPDPNNPGLWYHNTRRTRFCLCVDDFGIKYFSKDDAEHLINVLKKYYKVSIDWTGKNYCGFEITWNYEQKYVDIQMPGYIEKLL